MSVPTVHRGAVVKQHGEVEIKEQAVPKYTEDQVLIKVKAVSIDPVDFKVNTCSIIVTLGLYLTHSLHIRAWTRSSLPAVVSEPTLRGNIAAIGSDV
jgi:hypothetical protein